MKKKLSISSMPMLAVQVIVLPLVIWLLCIHGAKTVMTLLYAEIFVRDIEQHSQLLTMSSELWANDYKEDPGFISGRLEDRLETFGRTYRRSGELLGFPNMLILQNTAYQIGIMAYSADDDLLCGLSWDSGSAIKYKNVEYTDMDALLLELQEQAKSSPSGDAFFSSSSRDSIFLDHMVLINMQSVSDESDTEYMSKYSGAPLLFYIVTVYHVSPSQIVEELLSSLCQTSFVLMVVIMLLILLNIHFNLTRPLHFARRALVNGWHSVSAVQKRPRGWKEPHDILQALSEAHGKEEDAP